MLYHRTYIQWISLLAALFILCVTLCGAGKRKKGHPARVQMEKASIRMDDGDSFFYRGLAIRILGIDAPEIIHEEHGIFEDQPCGRKAAAMTAALLREAKTIEYLPYQNDKYGRLLAHVFVDGDLLSVHLINAGLAYETVSYYGDNGFPELAQKILEAARKSPLPPFEKPYRWRRKHQVKR